MRWREKERTQKCRWVSLLPILFRFALVKAFLLILFNYPKKHFLHSDMAATVPVPQYELCNLIKPHLKGI